jgi:hypothetical protein
MSAAYFDFTKGNRCEKGSTFDRTFEVKVGLTESERHAIARGTVTEAQQESIDTKCRNLTGYTARMQARATVAASSTILSLTTENGGITLGGTDGTITLFMSATTTAALTAGEHYYDLEIVNGAVVERVLQGRFEVDPEVTR